MFWLLLILLVIIISNDNHSVPSKFTEGIKCIRPSFEYKEWICKISFQWRMTYLAFYNHTNDPLRPFHNKIQPNIWLSDKTLTTMLTTDKTLRESRIFGNSFILCCSRNRNRFVFSLCPEDIIFSRWKSIVWWLVLDKIIFVVFYSAETPEKIGKAIVDMFTVSKWSRKRWIGKRSAVLLLWVEKF